MLRRSILALIGLLATSAAAPAAEPPWWGDAVFYQVYTRSFFDSRTGPLANDGVGDIQGMIEQLDYLNDGDPNTTTDLGVTGIWLLPMAQSDHPAGYSVMDYETIESDYGTNEDFRRFIAEAHKRGIRVVVDLVLNHCSHKHPWFIAGADPDSPYHDFFHWRAERPTEHGETYAKRWCQHPNGSWYYSAFGSTIPDLNVDNPVVKEKLFQVAKFWLEDMGVDGFRLDAIKHLYEDGPINEHVEGTHAWLRDFQTWCKSIKPDSFIVGEVWSGTNDVAKYTPDQVDANFQFELAGAFIAAAATEHVGYLPAKQEAVVRAMPAPHYAPFLTNHDMMRVMEQLDRRPGRMRTAAALLLTSPGVPFVYYGEEVGINGHNGKGRSPMQWSAEDNSGFSTVPPHSKLEEEWETFNVETQSGAPDSILSGYKELIRLRHASPALRRGGYLPLQVSPADIENYVVVESGVPAAMGYAALEEGGARFVFDPARYQLPDGIDIAAISNVSVAGDFNDWSPGAWLMDKQPDGTYTLERNHWSFSIEAHEFKFVVNGEHWLEPPLAAPNRKHAGLENPSYNFVLRRGGDLRVDACRVEDGAAFLTLDPSVPATWTSRQTGATIDPASIVINTVTAPGSFNDWSDDALPLQRSPAGVWEAALPGEVQPDRRDEFRFLVNGDIVVTPDPATHNRTPAMGGAPVYAFLRTMPDHSLLCLINLSHKPVSTYSISGGAAAIKTPSLTAIDLVTGKEMPTPTLDAAGALHEYQPVPELAPHSWTLIKLTPKGIAP